MSSFDVWALPCHSQSFFASGIQQGDLIRVCRRIDLDVERKDTEHIVVYEWDDEGRELREV
jgi:hypothetical protein